MNKKSLIVVLIFLSVSSISFSIYSFFTRPKIAFFEYNSIYNNCSLKKKLEEDLKKVGSVRNSQLDSLQLELTFVSDKIKSNTASDIEKQNFEMLRDRFLNYQEKYQEENMQLKESYFNQIREYINEKAKLYAESKGYDFLLSANGDGALMFGSEKQNVTDDFLRFVK